MAGDAGADRNTLPIELRTLNAVGPAASASSSTVAGIDNELLYNPKTAMLFGNTEDSFTKLDAAGWSS